MAEAAEKSMSLAAFLAWDDGADARYELLDGRVVAMAPPMEAHGTIVADLAASIRPRLKAPCRVVVEAGITPPDRADTWYQADLVVTCAPPERGARAIAEPGLIVEVLSRSTAAHDRGIKLTDYRRIDSVEQILVVASEDRHVEAWRRAADGWTVQDLIGDAAIMLANRRPASVACRRLRRRGALRTGVADKHTRGGSGRQFAVERVVARLDRVPDAALETDAVEPVDLLQAGRRGHVDLRQPAADHVDADEDQALRAQHGP
jgi:Uma2 family endonuclease